MFCFAHGARAVAIYCNPKDALYCTYGLGTIETVHLAHGLVIDHLIECQMHNGQFDYRTGAATRSPACEALRCYPVKVEGEDVFVDLG